MKTKSHPIPSIPAAARKAGATKFARCSERSFNLSFKITDGGYSDPGNGQAVVDAIKTAMPDAVVTWSGAQASAINVKF